MQEEEIPLHSIEVQCLQKLGTRGNYTLLRHLSRPPALEVLTPLIPHLLFMWALSLFFCPLTHNISLVIELLNKITQLVLFIKVTFISVRSRSSPAAHTNTADCTFSSLTLLQGTTSSPPLPSAPLPPAHPLFFISSQCGTRLWRA